MSDEPREDGGRFAERVTLDDVLGVFDAVEGPVVTSGDVADALACSRETSRRKLRELAAMGRLDSRKTAGRVVWWRVERPGRPSGVEPNDPFWALTPGSSGETDVSAAVDEELYDP